MTQTDPAAESTPLPRYTAHLATPPQIGLVAEIQDRLTGDVIALIFQHPAVDAPGLAAQVAGQLNAENERVTQEALKDDLLERFAQLLQGLPLAQLQVLKESGIPQAPREPVARYEEAVHRFEAAVSQLRARGPVDGQGVSRSFSSEASEPAQPGMEAPEPERPLGRRTKLDEFKPGWYAGEDGTVAHYETFPFAPIVGPFPSESVAAQHSAPYRQGLAAEAFRAVEALVPLAGKVREGQKLRQAQGEQLLTVLKAIEEADTQDATSIRVLISHLPTQRALLAKGFRLDPAPTRGLEQCGEWFIVSWKDA